MRAVITSVGVSLFQNYSSDKPGVINSYYKRIENKRNQDWNKLKDSIQFIREEVYRWAKGKEDVSAEIKSITQLLKEEKTLLHVCLLASDTVTSRLAAEIIKDLFDEQKDIEVSFNENQDVISGLQVEDHTEFCRTGAHNFITRVIRIINDKGVNTIFNISSGYKSIVPFMTIMANAYDCEIVYIFEESNCLIRIPKVPIQIDFSIFRQFYHQIVMLEVGIENYNKTKGEFFQEFSKLEEKGLVEITGAYAQLSPIGIIFYERYKAQIFVFYCTDDVYKTIKSQPNISRIINEKFRNQKERQNQSKREPKGLHLVYDDGDNGNRIYYFLEQDVIYIYKTFENEEAARKYIQVKFDKEKIKRESTKREWGLSHV